jgi:hypothetical protein
MIGLNVLGISGLHLGIWFDSSAFRVIVYHLFLVGLTRLADRRALRLSSAILILEPNE